MNKENVTAAIDSDSPVSTGSLSNHVHTAAVLKYYIEVLLQ